VQVRHLRPGVESLEDVFLRALGHASPESASARSGTEGVR
jgi:hypothetical protein